MTAALGFGVSGPHGAAWFSERELARLIAQAIDGGVRHFDTAPFYGEAETRLGRALLAAGAAATIVSTKTGTRRLGPRKVKDFSAGAIRADVERSLKNLHRDRLDALYLHGPTTAQIDAALPTLLALKAEGKVNSIGVCGVGKGLTHAVARGFDAIMGAYNLIDRRHADVFAQAKAKGLQCVAVAPLAQGAFGPLALPLTPAGLWRATRKAVRGGPPDELVERAKEALSGIDGFTPSAAALAYVLQGGLVDIALTTTTNAARLAQSLGAARRPLDASVMARLARFALDPAGGRS